MIKIRDLTFEYFDRDEEGYLTDMINAIRGINFDAQKGEFIAVAGKNGSGKSTFAKILNRLLVPIEGTVVIGDMDAMDEENTIAVVHNGIIENNTKLKADLIAEGHTFKSDTDTEVIPHLIQKFMENNIPFKMKDSFPNIYEHCLNMGYDVTKQCIPVVPAQHYFMGGIAVDSNSHTSMNNLYAVGETACNGVHGANRLASNSLLESLVFAKRAAKHMYM